MSTTSPNFIFTLAQSTDQVDVSAHIANNFSTLDSLLAVVHTGSGQLKDGLTFVNPTLNGIVTITGTVGASTIVASTGSFQTITATGGALTVNSLTVGTMAIPAAIGSSGQLLGVSGGALIFLAPSAASGPDNALSNLANVAINTNLNTFSAGFVTVNRIIATSGSLTGVTAFQSTTGTFTNLTVLTSAGIPMLIGTNATITNIVVGFVTATGITMASGTVGALLVTSAAVSTGIFTALTATAVVATNATLANATVSGTATIARVAATTAVAATLTANAVQIGTYSLPATIGSTAQVLTVTTGNAVWATPTGQTGYGTLFGVYGSTSNANFLTVPLVMTAGDIYEGYLTFDDASGAAMNTSPCIVFNATTEGTNYFTSVTSGTRPSMPFLTGAPITSGVGIGTLLLIQESARVRVMANLNIVSVTGAVKTGESSYGHYATQVASVAFLDPSGNGRFRGSVRFLKIRSSTA